MSVLAWKRRTTSRYDTKLLAKLLERKTGTLVYVLDIYRNVRPYAKRNSSIVPIATIFLAAKRTRFIRHARFVDSAVRST